MSCSMNGGAADRATRRGMTLGFESSVRNHGNILPYYKTYGKILL